MKLQKGNIGIIITIVIALLLGAGGYMLGIQKNNNDKIANDKIIADLNDSAKNSPKLQDRTSIIKTKDYLVIPELGVKIPLSDEIKDLTYSYTSGTLKTAGFSSKSLTTLNKKGSCVPDGLGDYEKIYTSQLSDNADAWWNTKIGLEAATHTRDNLPPQAKKFSNFYILYIPSQAVCSDTPEGKKVEVIQHKALWNAVSGIIEL